MREQNALGIVLQDANVGGLRNQSLKICQKQNVHNEEGNSAWPDLEDELEKWIIQQCAKGLPVPTVQIRLQVKQMALLSKGIPNFNGNPNWCHCYNPLRSDLQNCIGDPKENAKRTFSSLCAI